MTGYCRVHQQAHPHRRTRRAPKWIWVRFKTELYHTIVIVWVYYTTQVDDTRPEAGFLCNESYSIFLAVLRSEW